MEEILNAVILAAEETASQASRANQGDWSNFADALRRAKEDWAKQRPPPAQQEP
jgi:hypothetical protein